MNISINSAKTFVFVNSFLLFLSLFQYKSTQYFITNYDYQVIEVLFMFLIFIVRNYLLLYFIESGTKNKPVISNINLPKEEYENEFDYNVITTTVMESFTHTIIQHSNIIYIFNNSYPYSYSYSEIIYFIPISFCFEIIFDLFHYLGHRFLHNKYIYKYLHKKHHKFKHPKAITTFYQDPIDLIITNSIPTILTLCIIPNNSISYLQFNLITVYKNFIEISGHIGKKTHPTCCFSQFIWLPKLLNIELYAEDHDLHHSSNNCNYSKRFSLWDKLFGTYRSSYHVA
jgi:sterol desaturase/sphingolipid hydroxylase (fatty acid hydroxylase superfamily)